MLTEREQDIIRRWHEFYLQPPHGTIQENRTRLVDYVAEFNADQPEVGAYHEAVQLKPGLTADIAVPKGRGGFPVVVYIHGGAWTLGSPATTHRKLIKQFAEAGSLTVAPDYRLAPENPFPACLDDCLFTAAWTAENAARYSCDSSRTAIGRASAGEFSRGRVVASGIAPSRPEVQSRDPDLWRLRFRGVGEDGSGSGRAAGQGLSREQLSGSPG